ncbi:MAG: ribonuclease PH [Verrucomicrobiota bacterium]
MLEFQRPDGRQPNELRPLRFQVDIAPHASGSVLISCGDTQVICAATIEDNVPRWMKAQNVSGGWLTAEYSMLPYSTLDRKQRDISKGRQDGRSVEIQRLILRAVLDLEKLPGKTLWIDCDVLRADGGTRTASITGAYVAAELAVRKLLAEGRLKESPFKDSVAAISVGILADNELLDLNYLEDRDAEVDSNVVMTGGGRLVEAQASGEEATFTREQWNRLLDLAEKGIGEITVAQRGLIA